MRHALCGSLIIVLAALCLTKPASGTEPNNSKPTPNNAWPKMIGQNPLATNPALFNTATLNPGALNLSALNLGGLGPAKINPAAANAPVSPAKNRPVTDADKARSAALQQQLGAALEQLKSNPQHVSAAKAAMRADAVQLKLLQAEVQKVQQRLKLAEVQGLLDSKQMPGQGSGPAPSAAKKGPTISAAKR